MTAEPTRPLPTAAVTGWLESWRDRVAAARDGVAGLAGLDLGQVIGPLLAERDILRRRCELLEATDQEEEPVAVRPARDPWAETAALRDRVAELEASYRELELTAGGRLDASGQAVAELQRAHDATRSALSGLATAAELHAAACGCGSYGEVEATKQALETAVTGARVRLGGVTRRALPADDDTAELTPAVHRPPAAAGDGHDCWLLQCDHYAPGAAASGRRADGRPDVTAPIVRGASGGKVDRGTVVHACVHPVPPGWTETVRVSVCGMLLVECWTNTDVDCRRCRRLLAKREAGADG